MFEFKVEILVFLTSRSPSVTLAGTKGILVILPIATQFACHVLANPDPAAAATVGGGGHMNFRDKNLILSFSVSQLRERISAGSAHCGRGRRLVPRTALCSLYYNPNR